MRDKKKKTNIKFNDLKPKKMPRVVWQPTSARAVASRVARLTKLTAASKGKEAAPRFDPGCGSCLRRVSRTRRAAVLPNRRVSP